MRVARWPSRSPAPSPQSLVAVLIGLLVLVVAAWGARGVTVDIGEPGDLFLLRQVHGDERAAGRSYRWTRPGTRLVVPGFGGAQSVRLTLQAESGRPAGQAVPVGVLIDGEAVAALSIGAAGEWTVEANRPEPGADTVVVEVVAPTFRPAGDARDLGIIVDRMTVEPVTVGLAPVAWAERFARLMALAAVLTLALLAARRWARPTVWALLAALLVASAAALARPWLLAAWPWLLGGLAGLAVLTNERRAVAGLIGLLAALDRPRLAALALGGLVVAHALAMTLIAAQIEWIGHADYADNAVVARNLVAGRGYTVDYVAQFYRDYPTTISHPADVWPLLQPTLIALSFLLFGVSTFAAKLPNVAIMAGLLLATAWVGGRLFGRVTGLAAAGLLALDSFYFEGTLFPLNDLAFSLLALLLVGLAGRLDEAEAATGRPVPRLYLLVGLVAGLLFIAKPSGALLALGVAGWWLWRRRPSGAVRWPGWRWALVGGVVAVLVTTPVLTRNLLTFGVPFFTTEAYDAWVTKWEPPDENIYRLMAADLPHPRRLIGFGLDRAVEAVTLQFRKLGRDLVGGTLIETPLLLLAGLGLAIGPPAVRRHLVGLAWAVVPYLLFILIYWHYEERYFIFLTPWLGLLAVGGLTTLARPLLAATAGQRRLTVWGLVLGGLLLLGPRLEFIAERLPVLTPTAGDVVVGAWLAANTPPETVIMTRVPWQITWHSQRRTVMIPLAPANDILATTRRYGVEYVMLNGLGNTALRREGLAPLYEGREVLGFQLVQEFKNDRGQRYALLYRVPPSGRSSP